MTISRTDTSALPPREGVDDRRPARCAESGRQAAANRIRGAVRLPNLTLWVRPAYHRSPWIGPTPAAFIVLALLYTWAAPVIPHGGH
jgi:hypothetical protein